MKIFDKIFKKDHDLTLEEKEKFQQMTQNRDSETEEFHYELAISQLRSLEEINRIRNLLDKRQEELESGSSLLVASNISHSDTPEFEEISVPSKGISEVNVEQPITEDDLNNETYEESTSTSTPSNTYEKEYSNDDKLNQFEEKALNDNVPDMQFGSEEEQQQEIRPEHEMQYDDLEKEEEDVPIPEEILEKEEKVEGIKVDLPKEEENNDFVELHEVSDSEPIIEDNSSVEVDMFYNKVKDIFGEDNIVKHFEESSSLDLILGKKALHIGIRQKEKFGVESDILEENAWFISHVKQLDDLSSFKMIKSDKGMKDLLWDRDNFAIILSFRATSFLTSIEEFDFDL